MTTSVFLSRPTLLTDAQDGFCSALMEILAQHGLRPRTVGLTDFGNRTPLSIVRRVMAECAGAMILGFGQLTVESGMRKPGTRAEVPVPRGLAFPTPWNQLEAGMAFVLSLPLFVVRESSVAAEGIFDAAVADYFVHHAELTSDWLRSPAFQQPFEEWAAEVRAYKAEGESAARAR